MNAFKPLVEYLEARAQQHGEAHKVALACAKKLEAEYDAMAAVEEAAKKVGKLNKGGNKGELSRLGKLNQALANLATLRN